MASRKHGRKVAKVSSQEKKVKAIRNEKRKRTRESIAARQWEKKHVVRPGPFPDRSDKKSKRKRVLEATVEALRSMPGVDDVRAGRGTIPNTPLQAQTNAQEEDQDGE